VRFFTKPKLSVKSTGGSERWSIAETSKERRRFGMRTAPRKVSIRIMGKPTDVRFLSETIVGMLRNLHMRDISVSRAYRCRKKRENVRVYINVTI